MSLYDMSKEALRPVFGVDIDGTIGEYHGHFARFASEWLGRDLPDPAKYEEGSFYGYLGISRSTYRKIKLAYRRGGLKRSMPVIDGAQSLVSSLRERGALVVLCTTRPYLSLENIDEDTRHWSRRNQIVHDSIIWGEHKYQELARFGDRLVGVIDDDLSMIKQAENCGIRSFIHARPYNNIGPDDYANRGNINVARDIMSLWLDQWEGKNL